VKYAAVSGGRMSRETAMKFTSSIPLEHVTFVPLCGGVDKELWDIQENTVCEYFASHCGAAGLQLHTRQKKRKQSILPCAGKSSTL